MIQYLLPATFVPGMPPVIYRSQSGKEKHS